MSRVVKEEYGVLMREAQRRGRCLVANCPSMRKQLKRMLGRGELVSPIKGLYADPGHWSSLTAGQRHLFIARALHELHPDWVFSHFTAAAAYGLSVSFAQIAAIHRVSSRGSRADSTPDIVCHISRGFERSYENGIPVTSFEQTVVDCLRASEYLQGVAIADSALRASGMTSMQLCELLDAYCPRGNRGIVTARRAAAFADGRAESGGESIARAAMAELGFLLPELQVEMGDPLERGRRYRADFLWTLPDGSQVIGEFDGREKYVNPEMTGGRDVVDVLADERLRESRISASGARIMRFSYRDVCNRRFFDRLLRTFRIPHVMRTLDGRSWVETGASNLRLNGEFYPFRYFSPKAA